MDGPKSAVLNLKEWHFLSYVHSWTDILSERKVVWNQYLNDSCAFSWPLSPLSLRIPPHAPHPQLFQGTHTWIPGKYLYILCKSYCLPTSPSYFPLFLGVTWVPQFWMQEERHSPHTVQCPWGEIHEMLPSHSRKLPTWISGWHRPCISQPWGRNKGTDGRIFSHAFKDLTTTF